MVVALFLGEASCGSIPPGEELLLRNDRRLINRAQSFINANRIFDADGNFVFDSTRSCCPDKSLERNSSINLPIIKAKCRRSLQTTHLASIAKKYHCIGKNIIAIGIAKNSDSFFQVKLKEQNKTFIVDVGLEIYCSCITNERAYRKTYVHIV